METLIANITGGIRRESLNGRDYIVAPMSLLVPGILNGSKGPLYYPQEEITKNADLWNHTPIVVYHPTKDGLPVSARDPDVLNSQGIGFVFRSKANGKLTAEGWFDVEATNRIDNRILTALETGKKIELSTGLYTENEVAPEGATFNGGSYEFIARNYRPDHLAILPDQTGACSIQDGCGVLVNKEESSPQEVSINPNEETISMGKKELIDGLIANCDCWKEEDREVLANFSEDKLESLKKNVEKSKQEALVANAAREGFEDSQGNLHAFNEKDQKWETAIKEVKPDPVINKEKKEEEVKPQTEAEWLASAPSGIQSAVQNAMRIEAREREALVKKIIANAKDDVKERLSERLANKSLDELEDLSLLAPEPISNKEGSAASFFGMAGAPPVANKEAKIEPLELPTINWAEST